MGYEAWASSESARRVMRANKSRHTKPEVAIRRALHAMGLRYRLHVKPLPEVRFKPDIVFRRAKVAVEVHGCFWHRCPQHYREPATNRAYWQAKVERNVIRDARNREALESVGWTLLTLWEHEDPNVAAQHVADVVRHTMGTPSCAAG
ncbi:very short patch repair endonuclease [Lentzea aerocolonigenes]|uniref:very short patch repair endonuclease n=1 Tax=Lentzea aerocolonigenes TaxID=68170 RepID=UPI0022AA59BC|nr:very short patch repair endonuclease [Lentzea aerocolonigenes]